MNSKFLRVWSLVLCVVLTGWISACSDDDPELPDNLVAFETATAGLADDEDEIVIHLKTDRAISSATTLQITLTPDGVVYGEDFTTDPAATGNTLSVTVPANTTAASFTVVRTTTRFLEGTESVAFEISNVGTTGLVLGTTKTITLSFSSIVSEGSELTLQGLAGEEAGASAANSVFVNFKSNTQNPVLRTSWDLGFYSGDQFRVILNNTRGSSAVQIDETNLNAVTVEDVNTTALTIQAGNGAYFSVIDDVYGDINNTVIAGVSETADNNKVYLISPNFGTAVAENVFKVRILRNGNGGYTLQYAKVTESAFRTLDVPKNENANFTHVSFGTGDIPTASVVSVEPKSWDIQWGWSIYYGGSGESTYPYGFSDVVFINHLGGVKAAQVLTSTVTYDAYSEANIAATTFLAERNVIGSTWRATTGTIGVFSDRFYVIQDAAGNVYKLKFISFHPNEGGTRGKPVIKYNLVKKAE